MSRARRLAALAFAPALASSAAAAPPPPAPPGSIAIAGAPTGVVAFAGTRALLVGFEGRFGRDGGIAVYRRNSTGTFALAGTARTASPVQGLALSPDGRTVVATTRVGLAAVDLAALANPTAPVVELRTGAAPDANQIVFSRAGDYAYFTEQRYAQLQIVRATAAAPGAAPTLEIVSHVALDRSPGGLALSPDGANLYVTSESDTADGSALPGAADPRLGRVKCAANLAPSGDLSVVDTAKALVDPAHAVVARVAAGCAPTRVALSPDGTTAWVTVRGENRVIAFATGKLRSDPAHALVTSLPVGDVPVGLAVSSDGRTLLVADSHRSRDADDARAADLCAIDVAAALAGKAAKPLTLPTGALAREVTSAPNGGFFVTNYLSRSIAVVKPEALQPPLPSAR